MQRQSIPALTMALGSTIVLALLGGCTSVTPPAEPVDVVISGGTIYDGSGGEPYLGDVALRGDRIVYVGPQRDLAARRTIDARGMIVAPGFIDPHTHAEVFLNSPDPEQRVNAAWLAQGVSTVMIGVDGGGSPDVAQAADRLETSGIGTNAVPFVGFGAVRSRVMGEEDRTPSGAELAAMKELVAQAMCDGARGFSTGLFYAPQSFAETGEVIEIAREAAIRGGIYDTHQRDESSYSIGLLASVAEVIRIGRETGMPVHIAHIKALGVDVQGQAPAVIAMVEKARAQGIDVTADQYPWLASGTSLEASLLPPWALDGGNDALRLRLAQPDERARMKADMAENLRRRGGASAMLLTSPDLAWTGKTLAQMADLRGENPVDTALAIIARSLEHGGGQTNVASFNMAHSDVDLFMRQPWVVTASDGSNGHPRMYATYPEKYDAYVLDRRIIDLGNFIRQSTGKVADIYGIEERGYLKSGYFADVLVFDPGGYAPRADYVNPRELATGVSALFVNGALAVENSNPTGTTAGRVLLRPAPANCQTRPR